MAELFSESWAVDWGEELRRSAAYRQAAATWEGDLVLELAADTAVGVLETRAVYLDLWRGDCRDARSAVAADCEAAKYFIAADPTSWMRVLRAEVAPVAAIMRGMLRLRRGSVAGLMPHVPAAKELVLAATRIETSYPPGLA